MLHLYAFEDANICLAETTVNACGVLVVQEPISVWALVFDLAQLTCQKRFEVFCNIPRHVVESNCGSSFADGRQL